MLPVSDRSPSELQSIKKTKTSELSGGKNSLSPLSSALHPYFSPQHPRTWILLTILFIQISVLFCIGSFSPSRHRHQIPLSYTAESISEQPSSGNSGEQDQCGFGKIFVYDLPKTFNQEILDNCDNLNPWSSRCDALSNDGFGQQATGLAGLVPEELIPAWYWTDQFVSEVIFHNRILNHKCRVLEPESATAFYIPFYAGLAVGKYLWSNGSAKERDHHCEMLLKWVQDQTYYKRSNGWDHFITMGRITWDFRRSKDEDWGSSCIYMAGMRNITRLLIERNPWDYFDVGVPYPTGFHPRSDSDVTQWQNYVRERKRNTLFCFAGAKRGTIKNDFRGLLLSQCENEQGSCRVVNCSGARCSNGTSAILETFLDSDFCLQPRGDSFTRRSIFDCMIAGSIPVFFWRRTAYFQYEWFLPGEPESFSVFIHRDEVKNGTSIKSVLEKYSKEEVRKMREKVIDYMPKFLFAKPQDGLETVQDAFDVAIDGVLRRFKEHREWEFKW
ncbi:Xyloglucan galactosyltransferase [Quillaja saponaria]|uniref:Xyloglucan galactosyltransferase n=1 Tax=Quillaja saponaria TaxID=32244 RepID=A0AAD7VHF8_QUISA|nr:Xyloglucan galactosyltransferase [Quillaja saponaria]